MFLCPGCGNYHTPKTLADGKGFTWEFNGDLISPTFSPSLLFTEHDQICHSFVTAGEIHFYHDSTHNLKGRTVRLFDI